MLLVMHPKNTANFLPTYDQVKIIHDRFEGTKDASTQSLRVVLQNASTTLIEFKEKLAKYSDLGISQCSINAEKDMI